MRIRMLTLCMCLLACSGCARRSTDQLIVDLKSAQEAVRLRAVRLLPQRKGDAEKIVPALAESLQDRDGDVRWSAAIGLGYFGESAASAIPALQAAEHDSDARVREAAAVALARIDPARFPRPMAGGAMKDQRRR